MGVTADSAVTPTVIVASSCAKILYFNNLSQSMHDKIDSHVSHLHFLLSSPIPTLKFKS